MSGHASNVELTAGDVRLGEGASKITVVAGAVGVIGMLASIGLGVSQGDKLKSFLYAYETAFIYFLTISLGALFFVIIQHLVKAGWSVVVRRLGELIAANLPLMAVLSLPILIPCFMGESRGSLFIWLDPEIAKEDHLIHVKQAYLNQNFFLVRCIIYFAVWTGLSMFYLKTSLKQDETGDPKLTILMKTVSAPAIILFAFTTTFFAFDFMMSLDPHWFSTIWGVYFFAGCVVSFFATLAIFTYRLQRTGRLKNVVNQEHYHDIGKMLFAFVFFWGYISFSQYMLIWYANMPEETVFFDHRRYGGWLPIGLVILFGHFLIPFVGLISRWAKRITPVLIFWAVWMLVMHWLDLFWAIKPNYSWQTTPNYETARAIDALGLMDLTCFLAVGGLFIANLMRMAAKHPLVPMKDPRLGESMAFHNL